MKTRFRVIILAFVLGVLLCNSSSRSFAASSLPGFPSNGKYAIGNLTAQTCFTLLLEVDGGMGSPRAVTPPDCAGGQYSAGKIVSIAADPAAGFRVYRWRGTDDDVSTSLINSVTMNYDRRVGVHYIGSGDPTVPVSRGTPGGVATVKESGVGLESVIGTDERTHVTNTTDIPWRRIASLDVHLANGSWSSCTGFFVGRRVVATAGHCVYNSAYGGWAQDIKVMPGRNSSSQPYGSKTSTNLWSVSGWTSSGLTEYDYGAIVLPDDVLGDQVGWFDYGYYSDGYLQGMIVNIAGYPGDKSDPACFACQLWTDADPITAVAQRIISYEVDTYGGESGSPIWWYDGANRAVVGIHTSGVGRTGCNAGDNCGTRITQDVAQFFQDRGAPAPVTNCNYTLSTSVSPSGSGSVSVNPAQTSGCPAGRYTSGAVVNLTANPTSGYVWLSWIGTNNNSVNPTTVTMTGSKSVTANFQSASVSCTQPAAKPVVTIPATGEWVEKSLVIADAPTEARVTDVRLKYKIQHPAPENLEIRLVHKPSGRNFTVWDHQVSHAKTLAPTISGLSAFNGVPANGEWALQVRSTLPGEIGSLEDFSVIPYYPYQGPTLRVAGSNNTGVPLTLHLPSGVKPLQPKDKDAQRSAPTQPNALQRAQMVSGWQIIKSESFEGAFPNTGWTLYDLSNDGYDRYWNDDDYKPYTGSWAAWPANGGTNALDPAVYCYPNNMSTWMIYGPFDLSDATNASTTFHMWREIEAGWDYLFFGVSSDGVTFNGLYWDGNAGWEFKDIYHTSYVGDPSVWVAWKFYSDSSVVYRGAWLDDITIFKHVSSTKQFYLPFIRK